MATQNWSAQQYRPLGGPEYDQSTTRKYEDKVNLSNTESMTPGTTQVGRENMAKQGNAQRREETMRRYFGDALDDPYFDPTSEENMAKTPEGRARLHQQNVVRREGFEAAYRPMLESEARAQWATGHMGGRIDTRMGAPGYALGKPAGMYSNPIYGRPDLAPPQVPSQGGVSVYGGDFPNYKQVQPALNAIWNRTRAIEKSGMYPEKRTAFAPTAAAVFGYGGGSSG